MPAGRKVAKLIILAEEQRRDSQHLPSRSDDEATAMSKAAEPEEVFGYFWVPLMYCLVTTPILRVIRSNAPARGTGPALSIPACKSSSLVSCCIERVGCGRGLI